MATIAIDLMGGDHSPGSFIEALAFYYKQNDHANMPIKIITYGEKEKVEKACLKLNFSLEKHGIEFNDFSALKGDEKPTSVLRLEHDTSLSKAIKDVECGKAQVVLSGGETGSYMILCMKILGLNGELKRPVLLKPVLNLKNSHTLVLDVGANADISEKDMWYLAKVGTKACNELYKIKKPIVKILNIGEEEYKGNIFTKQTSKFFKEQLISNPLTINYQGFIEGNRLFSGESDVIVCDGFSGNIAIKSFSGGMNFVLDKIKKQENLLKKVCAIVDPKKNNGAIFAGLAKGIAIKSHGSSDAQSCYYALKMAIDSTSMNLN